MNNLKKLKTLGIVVLIVLMYLFIFTGIIGKPILIYIPSSTNKIVRLSEITCIDVDSSEKSIKNAKKILEYNDKVESVNVGGGYFKNIDFIPYENNIKEFTLCGCNIDDWNAIKYCKDTETLLLLKSNFTDFSLLETMNQITTIWIETSEEIKYTSFQCFECLEELTIDAPNVDIGKISDACTIKGIWIQNANTISEYKKIKSILKLRKIFISESCIDVEFLQILCSMKLDDLRISNCRITNTKKIDINKVSEKLKKEGYDVDYNNNIINVKID
ncbi:MAG: hypothetical protein J6A58_14220 [Oscillospiraceae bacterium]|nr:hypothetical protein [Oscillospiraceae bacterium]